MKDVDSATKRLDNIFMTLYILVVALIFAVMLVRILFVSSLKSPALKRPASVAGCIAFFVGHWHWNFRSRFVLAHWEYYAGRQVRHEIGSPRSNIDLFV
jgi:hypothetical protein